MDGQLFSFLLWRPWGRLGRVLNFFLIPLRCSGILWLWFSSSSDGYLPACPPPLTRRKGKEEESFCSVGWTTPAAATGCRADAFCLQSSLFRGRQASAKINQYSMNLWSALVFWVTSLSLMGSVMLRDVALHHTDVLSHSGHSASHFISHLSGSFAFSDQHLP